MHDVIEPWQPQVGDWVRVVRGPECRAWHSQSGEPSVAYGRVESIDRAFDDPGHWVANVSEVQIGAPEYSEIEARRDAAWHRGHFYYVSDAEIGRLIDLADGLPDSRQRGPVTWIDGNYCALELTKVHYAEAVRWIIRARRELRHMPPGERLMRALRDAAS